MTSHTQIVATIGPPSGDENVIAEMIAHGMDIARINMSHGTRETNADYITRVRSAATKAGVRIPIILDLSGARLKTPEGHSFNAEAESSLTETDKENLAFAISKGVEYLALSFVGSAADVRNLRREIEMRGANIPIIAKIERAEAVEKFDEILAAADAIMIARGDLGHAVPIEDIPFLERDMVAKAKTAQKPSIVATQMLYTMTEEREPTRAEVTDVAYAVMVGADAVMLSDETAHGKYPLLSVSTMEKIVARTERSSDVRIRAL